MTEATSTPPTSSSSSSPGLASSSSPRNGAAVATTSRMMSMRRQPSSQKASRRHFSSSLTPAPAPANHPPPHVVHQPQHERTPPPSTTTTAATTTALPQARGRPRVLNSTSKAPIETVSELTHVQRLVEYFVVVSCRARTGTNNESTPPNNGSSTSHHRHGPASTSKTSNNNDASRMRGFSMQRSESNSMRRSFRGLSRRHNQSASNASLRNGPFSSATDEEPTAAHSSSQSTSTTHSSNHTLHHDDATTPTMTTATTSTEAVPPPPLPSSSAPGRRKASGSRGAPPTGNIQLLDEGSEYTFKPTITARYPLMDHPDNPLNPMVVQFCHPVGDIVVPTKSYELPRIHHFVLTNERGRKVYGTCLTVMEEHVPSLHSPWNHHSLTEEDDEHSSTDEGGGVELRMSSSQQQRRALYLPKVLCLLSTWPYLTAFREYLSQLYRLAVLTDAMPAPIERFVVNLYEIPAPPPGSYEVQLQILNSTIRFWAPPAKLPVAYTALPYQILFECLEVDHVLKLWTALLMERKILLVSSQHSILTVCTEILGSLLFPMRWSHLYIPLLPNMLCPMLDAPVPYLCGIVRENWLRAQSYVSGDTVVVDLDRNSVVFGDMVLETPPLPAKKFQKLRNCLVETVGHVFWRARGLEAEYRHEQTKKASKRNLDGLKRNSREWVEKLNGLDHAFNLAYTPDSPNLLSDTLPDDERQKWDKVQSAFLRFFTALFKGYRKFLVQAGPTRFTFDRVGFLASQKSEKSDFLVELTATQQFDDFITRRMYSPGEPDLVFFDQSINAKLNRSKLKIRKEPTPFLQAAKAHKDLKKVSGVEVNVEGLAESRFVYDKWPDEFNPKLFSQPRPAPSMITAEFDRQSALVAKLRAFDADSAHDNNDDDVLEFYGGDYDESPEVAAFTVFFFVYSSLVGRDWQEYQRRRSEAVRCATPPSPMCLPYGDASRGGADNHGNDHDRAGRGSDRGESIEVVELSDAEHVAVNGCVEDLSMGFCDACPEDSILALKSAIAYCGDGAQDVYTKLFERTAEQVAELQLQLNAAALMKQAEEPIDDAEDALIEYEEAKEVANAQLDLAFEMLKTMTLRGLSTDSDAYLSLMEACGRCGDTQRALHLIELMRADGFAADGEVLGCFVAAFAHEEGGVADDGSVEVAVDTSGANDASATRGTSAVGTSTSDAYSMYLKKKLSVAAAAAASSSSRTLGPFAAASRSDGRPVSTSRQVAAGLGGAGAEDPTADAALSETSSTASSSFRVGEGWVDKPPTGGTAFLDWMSTHHENSGAGVVGGANGQRRKNRRRWRRRSTLQATRSSGGAHPVTDVVSHQLELSEALLESLYPNLKLDGSDCCPHCSHDLTEADVVTGWVPCSFQDCTSACPKCSFRFVPRFTVSTSSPSFHGSQGPQTPLYCEFLSPWVIRRELQHVIKGVGGENVKESGGGIGIVRMLDPSWRDGTGIEAALFWNVVLQCRRYRLPYSFLLQGSFRQSRLVLPRIPVDMT